MMTHIMGLYRENRAEENMESFRFRASEAGVMKRARQGLVLQFAKLPHKPYKPKPLNQKPSAKPKP